MTCRTPGIFDKRFSRRKWYTTVTARDVLTEPSFSCHFCFTARRSRKLAFFLLAFSVLLCSHCKHRSYSNKFKGKNTAGLFFYHLFLSIAKLFLFLSFFFLTKCTLSNPFSTIYARDRMMSDVLVNSGNVRVRYHSKWSFFGSFVFSVLTNPYDLRSQILFRILPKKRNPGSTKGLFIWSRVPEKPSYRVTQCQGFCYDL